ncbi:unnamed protein product [Psylliodes chrysocephalus]|uniref:DNA-directed DNA polymerase n=1 Tax=Psylliodes chrysocephalus TaxID=3402493 RepID=A0A9P0GGA0_9CUCU|nr:unnamed protein product [Psylliodes chrysocephala]
MSIPQIRNFNLKAIVVNGSSVVLDIILLVMSFPGGDDRAREKFSAAVCILHLIVRPFSTILLIKNLEERSGVTEEVYGEFKSELMTQASEFQEKDSNWSLQEIMFLDVNINRFNSVAASSYIKLPVTIMKRNAVLNIENKDNACFAWSINAAIFPAEGNPKYPSSYPHYDTMLDFTDEVRKYFSNEKEFNLMRRKGVFPYSYIDSFQKLDDEELPSRAKFFDNLKGEPITDEDYNRSKETDVLLLADVFENFRKVCLKKYKLDPAHYLTAPSLSWDAMLKYTQIELELLTDIDMLHFFKKGIRGGVAQCSKRQAMANNKFLPNYNPSKPESYIMYLDATNLYGAAMSESLPFGGFKWIPVENFDCNSVKDDASKGYVLEVDLEYPINLHDSHNDLPFCPESIIPPNGKHPKLIPNLFHKEKYIIHYRNLKQCLKYGLKLIKIHRTLESSWLKKYIELNTTLRNQANNDFEKDLFKLLVNAIFGKTMENVEKRKSIHLSTHWANS